MSAWTVVPKSPYFNVSDGLDRENRSDNKIAMLAELDMSSAERLREAVKTESGVKPSYTALVAKAVSLALRRHPHANRILVGPRFWSRVIQLTDVDTTVAVERDLPGQEQAVFAGTIRGTDFKDLATLTNELRELADVTPETSARLRQFKWIVEKLPRPLVFFVLGLPRLMASMWVEHRGGAVLISSPAKYGVDIMSGAWPYPLGFSFGKVKPRPVVIDNEVVARPTMWLTMSFDRRLMAGAPAARFFSSVCAFLSDAEDVLRRGGDTIEPSDEYKGDVRVMRRTAVHDLGRSGG